MTWTPIHRQASTRADPYFHWAKATNYAYYLEGKLPKQFPVILELYKTAREFAGGDGKTPPQWKNWMTIPAVYAKPPPGLEDTHYCTASVTETFLDHLDDESLKAAVKRVGIGLPTESMASTKSAVLASPPGSPKAGTVVTAVIDDALAFAHGRFQSKNVGTRIEFLWNQDGTANDVPGFGYGNELSKQAIDRLIRHAAMSANTLDEDHVYRLARYVDFGRAGHKPLTWRRTHGTHVMDLAAGYDADDAPDNRPIIGVQLPVATTADTSGRSLAVHVLDGVRYVLDRADLLRQKGPDLPVVVNLSYGLIAGPHDGSSILECALDELIALREKRAPLRIVLPSGNSRQSRCHARIALNNKEPQTLKWRILPDDATPSYLEVWLPRRESGQEIKLFVKSPTGETHTDPIIQGSTFEWRRNNQVLGQVIYLDTPSDDKGRTLALIALAPTATNNPGREVTPSGVWEITLRNEGPPADIEAWIQRDDTPYGYPRRGRQSRFEDPKYERHDYRSREVVEDNEESYVKRDGTINAIATGARTTIVAGFRRNDGESAKYSGGGKPKAKSGTSPDALAVSDDSVACHGVLAAGARSGSLVAMNGTSVAAPQVTRWIADEMAKWTPGGELRKVEDEANDSEKRHPGRSANRPPAHRGRGGRLLDLPQRRKIRRREAD